MSWTTSDIPDLGGRVAVVTGANGGLGLVTASVLARAGATVVMAARDQQKAKAAHDEILALHPEAALEVVELDLASLDSVRAAAEQISDTHPEIDILVNNAGVMGIPERRTEDGFEMQLGTNHLGHFALTAHLLPALLAAPAARVVTVTSTAHHVGRPVDPQNPHLHGRYRPWRAYGQSKLANPLFSGELQRRAVAQGTSLTSAAAHPGYSATNLTTGPAVGAAFLKPVLGVADQLLGQDDEMGALPQLYAATMSDVLPNDYWGPDGFREMRGHPKRVGRSQHALDDDVAGRLWSRSEELTAVTYPWP
jgi:NAD(P)-dependent dehydrogenase (short-subunit alcohol dehydrogenase family)